jgi:hypothetical protein
MPSAKSYKALLIRDDARKSIDKAKDLYKEKTGLDLNYTQFVLLMSRVFIEKEILGDVKYDLTNRNE